jgi:hypothetical protein
MLDVSQHVKLELLGTCTDYLCGGIYSKDCEALRKNERNGSQSRTLTLCFVAH